LPLPLLVQLQQPPTAVVTSAIDGTSAHAAPALPAAVTNSLPLPLSPAAATAAVAAKAAPANAALSPSLPLAIPPGSPATNQPATQPLAPPLARDATASLPAAPGPLPTPNASPPTTASITTPVNVSTNAQGGNPAPLSSTINTRLASGAAALASSPRVALANLAPASDKLAPKPTTSDGALPTNPRQLAAQGAQNVAEAPVVAAAHTSEQPLAPTKDNVASVLASPAAHEPEAQPPAVAPLDNGAANTPNPPPAAPVAQSAPLPDEPPATLPIIPHAVAEQVAINVHQAVKSGTDHIQIQLQPADLGTIDVKLNVNHDGRVTVVVSADRSDTLNLLQQDAGGLTQALRDAGLQADNSSLSFNLRGGFQFQQQQSAGSGGGSRDSGYPNDGDGGDVIAAPLPSLRRHAGALDIHV
jgi:flagellar hook-length control protein FliK